MKPNPQLWLVFFILSLLVFPQSTPDSSIKIAKFKGNRTAALSYTLDDGLRDQITMAFPKFQEYGLKATFFVIASKVAETKDEAASKKPGEWGGVSWEELKEVADQGHEISNHTWSHSKLTLVDNDKLKKEIQDADQKIFERLGKKPLTFCYPNNAKDDRVRAAVMKDHLAAREFQKAFGNTMTSQELNAWADSLIQKKNWGVTMIHGIASGYAAFSNPQELWDHLAYVNKHQDQIWVDTFLHVSLYNLEREKCTLKTSSQEHQKSFTLESPLDSKIYTQPLTIILKIPGVTSVKATQDGKEIPLTILPDCILVDCIPGSPEISVTW